MLNKTWTVDLFFFLFAIFSQTLNKAGVKNVWGKLKEGKFIFDLLAPSFQLSVTTLHQSTDGIVGLFTKDNKRLFLSHKRSFFYFTNSFLPPVNPSSRSRASAFFFPLRIKSNSFAKKGNIKKEFHLKDIESVSRQNAYQVRGWGGRTRNNVRWQCLISG